MLFRHSLSCELLYRIPFSVLYLFLLTFNVVTVCNLGETASDQAQSSTASTRVSRGDGEEKKSILK